MDLGLGPFDFCYYQRPMIQTLPMKEPTRLGDYLDLEWFLEQDRTLDLRAIQSRDRALGLEAQKQKMPVTQYFNFWLKNQRQVVSSPLPSSVWHGTRKLFLWLVLVLGFLSGFFVVRGLLQYFGLYPVNVFIFFLAAVFLQLMFSLLAAILLVARFFIRQGPSLPWASFFVLQLARLGSRLLPEAGFVRSLLTNHRYASFLAWEVLFLLQIGGTSFALGTLMGMLGSVAVTDLAFGWQSTLTSGANVIELMVSLFSWPWSWLPASWGLVPSPEQIEGSRIILKDGISGLASGNLVSWWPFLSLSLFCYGFLPRCLLLFFARYSLSRVENTFIHPDEARIVDRMQAPLVDHADFGEPLGSPLPVAHCSPEVLLESGQGCVQNPKPQGCVLILPPELEGCLSEASLDMLARQASGYPLGAVVTAELESRYLDETLGHYAAQAWIGEHERYVFLIEAWQPPIREALTALAHWGQKQESRSLFLVLVGRPRSGQWLTQPSAIEEQVWREALVRLSPLRVDILTMPTPEKS